MYQTVLFVLRRTRLELLIVVGALLVAGCANDSRHGQAGSGDETVIENSKPRPVSSATAPPPPPPPDAGNF